MECLRKHSCVFLVIVWSCFGQEKICVYNLSPSFPHVGPSGYIFACRIFTPRLIWLPIFPALSCPTTSSGASICQQAPLPCCFSTTCSLLFCLKGIQKMPVSLQSVLYEEVSSSHRLNCCWQQGQKVELTQKLLRKVLLEKACARQGRHHTVNPFLWSAHRHLEKLKLSQTC